MKIFCIVFLLSIYSFATGSFNLAGKLRSFDKERIEIQDTKKIYVINRKALGPGQDLLIKQTKSGKDIVMSVPFEAVEKVKALSEPKK